MNTTTFVKGEKPPNPLATPDDVARAFVESGEPSLVYWSGWATLRRDSLRAERDNAQPAAQRVAA